MPLYMDQHIIPGVKARDVAEAHRRDMLIQHDHRCNCVTYWIDEKRGNVFCLIEAPRKEAVIEMHHQAHGLVPHRIIEVNDHLVESFLGRISDPQDAQLTDDGLKVFHDPSLRIIMVIRTADPILLQHRLGREKSALLLQNLSLSLQRELPLFAGRVVSPQHEDHLFSFTSASNAIRFAKSIFSLISDAHVADLGLRTGIHAGEPVTGHDQLFGETISVATRSGLSAQPGQILISPLVRELVSGELANSDLVGIRALTTADEQWMNQLYQALEQKSHLPEFGAVELAHKTAVSQSQLYRKTVSLTGIPPNTLLKQFRLQRARHLLRKGTYSIGQITVEAGFSSPSYFTKCFKQEYGMLPMAYVTLAGA